MPAPLRIATLGVGRIVHRGLLPGIAGCDDAVLTVAASQRPGAAAELAAATGADAVDGYEAALRRDDVDAVYIPARGDEHGRWTLAAAAAGKHVLCEKPLAIDVAEAERMAAACRDAGVILFEAFMWRHQPRTLAVRDMLRREEFGPLRSIHAAFGFRIDPDDWRLDPTQAGGALYDVGCYGINAARLFAGEEPSRVDADARWSDSGVDLTTRVGLSFPSGVLATVACSFETPLRNAITIATDEAEVSVPNAFLPPENPTVVIRRDEQNDETRTYPGTDQYAEQMAAFVASVRSGTVVEPAEDGVANMRALAAALASAKRSQGAGA